MGVEHGGPDKGTETGDKPTKPDNNGGPPPDNPGSAAQPSRVESLRSAGWNVNGQPETSAGENGERGRKGDESTSTDSTSASAPADPTEAEKEPETGKAESGADSETGREGENDSPKPETGEAAPPDEDKQEPRTTETEQPSKADTELRSTGERNGEAVKGTEPLGGNDNRTEPGDKTPTHDAGQPARDDSESSKPMTRRESLENAGWNSADRSANGTDRPPPEKTDQDAGPREPQDEPPGDGKPLADAGDPKSGEVAPQDKPASPVPEGDNARTDEFSTPVGEQDAGKPPRDARAPAPGETGPQDERGGDGRPQDSGVLVGDSTGTGATANGDNSTGQAPEGQATEGTPEVKPLQEAEAKPLLQQDDPKPDASDEPPTPEPNGEGADKPADGDGGEPHTEPVGETTDQSTAPGEPESARNPAEQPENKPENHPNGEQPADQRTTDDTPSWPEEAGDRDRKVKEADLTEPVTESNRSDHESTRSRETKEPGEELPPHEENTPETEPGRFSGRITIKLDENGKPLPPSRYEADSGMPEFGEHRRPEDERKSEPEKPSRLLDLCREAFSRADDIKDSIDKMTEPAKKHLERGKPTGQLCVARPNYDHIKGGEKQLEAGNAVIGALGTVILTVQLGRQSIKLTRKALGRDHARN